MHIHQEENGKSRAHMIHAEMREFASDMCYCDIVRLAYHAHHNVQHYLLSIVICFHTGFQTKIKHNPMKVDTTVETNKKNGMVSAIVRLVLRRTSN